MAQGPRPLSPRQRLILLFVLVLAISVAGVSMVLAVRALDQNACQDADACEGASAGD